MDSAQITETLDKIIVLNKEHVAIKKTLHATRTAIVELSEQLPFVDKKILHDGHSFDFDEDGDLVGVMPIQSVTDVIADLSKT